MALKILSLGLGVQSTTLYFMSSTGFIDRCDYAVFADPQAESKQTYDYLKYLLEWQKNNDGIPIVIQKEKNILEDLRSGINSTGQRFAVIPAFTVDELGKKGMIRRQCTTEYKIDQVNKSIRLIQNKKPRQRLDKVDMFIGISLDEFQRMRLSSDKWRTNIYPLVDLRMTRNDCINWLVKNNFLIPAKSSCIFCPFHSDSHWLDMKENQPDEFNLSCEIDLLIRDSSKRGMDSKIYLHSSCKPLSEITFKNEGNLNMFNQECEGMCGV